MGLKRYFNPRLLAALGLGASLIAAVACGGASEAPAAPAAAPTAAPASSGSAAPTAMPAAAAPAAMAEETGGHVNLLVTNIGNGKFDPLLTEGEDLKFQRIFQVALVGGAGGSELTPAVAKDWVRQRRRQGLDLRRKRRVYQGPRRQRHHPRRRVLQSEQPRWSPGL